MTSWFESAFGFAEGDIQSHASSIQLTEDDQGRYLMKLPAGTFQAGRLETPTIEEITRRLTAQEKCGTTTDTPNHPPNEPSERRITCVEIVANIADVFNDPNQSQNAVVQVASQFNLLEMADPGSTPTDGIAYYVYDRTQGPVCAMRTPYGTLFRNYFAKVVEGPDAGTAPNNFGTGQLAAGVGTGQLERQVNCAADLMAQLGAGDAGGGMKVRYTYRNGYLFIPNEATLMQITKLIATHGSDYYEQYMRIGVHWDTQVVHSNHTCTLALCSALPIAYHSTLRQSRHWRAFALVVLRAAYKLTLLAAVENYEKTGCNRVYLTAIGGGVFGNDPQWICEAMRSAIEGVAHVPLEVYFVSYGRSDPVYRKCMAEMSSKVVRRKTQMNSDTIPE